VSNSFTYSFQFSPISVLNALHYQCLLTMWQIIAEVGCLVGTEWFGGVSHVDVIPDDGMKDFGATVLLDSEILTKLQYFVIYVLYLRLASIQKS